MNKMRLVLGKMKYFITMLFFLSVCFSLNIFYKSTLGLVANDFEEIDRHIAIILANFLPFICFLVYFYNYYIKKISKVSNVIYSVLVIGVSAFNLYGIFKHFSIFVSNSELGVYSSFPSLLFGFPYDVIIVSLGLILAQIYNLIVVFNPNFKYAFIKEEMYSLGYFKINIFKYLLVSVIGAYAFFCVGNVVGAFAAFENVLYDFKYLYLLLLFLLPCVDLLTYIFRVEDHFIGKKSKIIYHISHIGVNVLFILLFIIFEAIHPNFMVGVGKPLLPITYSISFPVETILTGVVLGISILINSIKIIKLAIEKK